MTKRALISVSDKTGILEFAKELVALGYEVVSTGGTKKLLQDNNVPVTAVDEVPAGIVSEASTFLTLPDL